MFPPVNNPAMITGDEAKYDTHPVLGGIWRFNGSNDQILRGAALPCLDVVDQLIGEELHGPI